MLENDNRKISFRITKDDVKNGIIGDGEKCPVALSIFRRLKRDDIFCTRVNVSPEYIFVGTDSFYWKRKVKTPLKLINFISAFDKGEEVKPINFGLVLKYA